ncbi:MAG: protein-disulfide reductase DsbD family protein [Bradymonadia bacterium]
MSDLITYVGAGIVGGLILNVMPCVLPVLFFKIHGWVSQGEVSSKMRKKESLAFLAGVLVCFTILAFVVEGVRQAGESMIWGEQMSNPSFVTGVVILLFVFGLNALGLFEFSFSVGGTGAQSGVWASFSHGALITLVSTPCSAPILGAATTAALAKSAQWYETMVLFWSIGFGLSLPVLAVGFVPGAHRILPKPGSWMNAFKSFVGFTLLGAAVFFLDALQGQLTKDAITNLLYFLTGLSLCLMVYEGIRNRSEGMKRWLSLSCLAMVIGGLGIGLVDVTPQEDTIPVRTASPSAKAGRLDWVPFRAEEATIEATLAVAKRKNQAVFVDFTADWCVNCKAFEKAYIDTASMAKVFTDTGVIAAKADYTRKDPPLREMLKALGRSGLPTYAIYFPDGSFDLLPNGPPLTLEERLRAAALKIEFLKDAEKKR